MKNKHLQFVYFEDIDSSAVAALVVAWMVANPEFTIHHTVNITGFSIGIWYED